MKHLILAAMALAVSATAYATSPPLSGNNTNVNQNTNYVRGGTAVSGSRSSSNSRSTSTSTSSATGGQGGEGGVGYGIGQAYSGGNSMGVGLSIEGDVTNIPLQRNNTPDLGSFLNSPTANCLITHGGGLVMAGFGFNLGSGTVEPGCDAREDARLLHNFGLIEERNRRLCMKPELAEAMGAKCPKKE